jgi:tripartite ATP-independent transporter DctM subunit
MDIGAVRRDGEAGFAAPEPTAPAWWIWIVEFPAAMAVLAEAVLLFAGIVARYVFDSPILWADELASLLFVWLAVLGSAVALHRNVHMRLTFLVSRLSPRLQSVAAVLVAVAPALYLLIIIGPSIDYAAAQQVAVLPALGWSGITQAIALPIGCALMVVTSLLRFPKLKPWDIAWVLAGIGSIAVVLAVLSPWLQSLGNWDLIIFFVGLLGFAVFAGVPIAFAFGLATVAYILVDTTAPLSVVVGQLNESMSSLILLAIPLFVFLGQLVEATGMARVMVGFLSNLVGHLRGGLYFVLIGAMYLISGISGSKTADMAAVAPVLFPEMKRRGVPEGEMLALLAATGAASDTIAPSIVLIVIGSVTNLSISTLFAAGLLPGIALGAALGGVAWYRARGDERVQRRRPPAREIGRSFVVAIPALVLPFVIRAAVVDGVATTTEVSTLGIVYALVVGSLVYRVFRWQRVYAMLAQTAALSGAILLIVGAAGGMSWALTQSGFGATLAQAMSTVPGGGFGFMLVSIVAFIILGSVLEGIPAIVLFGPLLFPLASNVGISEINYAIVAVLAMGIGLFSPPFGFCYYAACIIGDVDPDLGMRRIWPYLGAVALGLILVAAIPWIFAHSAS